jgi:hypothetical protein
MGNNHLSINYCLLFEWKGGRSLKEMLLDLDTSFLYDVYGIDVENEQYVLLLVVGFGS